MKILRAGGFHGEARFSGEFGREAAAQIIKRVYPVAEVAQPLGVRADTLHAWKCQLAEVMSGDACKNADIRQLKHEPGRVTEARDILKTTADCARDAK